MMSEAQGSPNRARGAVHLWHALRHVPALLTRNPGTTAYITYTARRSGRPADAEPISWVPFNQISPFLISSVIGAEDPLFFRHHGISWGVIRLAVRRGIRGKGWGGVSTITQQLARNLYLHPERTAARKAAELLLARRLERVLTKGRILELYLNVAEWGDGIWGIGAATRHYLGREAGDIGVFPSMVLASMLPAPRRRLEERNIGRLRGVQDQLAWHLYGSGVISSQQLRDARASAIRFHEAMSSGEAGLDVLRRMDREGTPARPPRLAVQDLVAEQCGLDRMLGFKRYMEGALRTRSPIPPLPMWWSTASDAEQPS